jgi:ABC-2 type transport system ATP-binding protein
VLEICHLTKRYGDRLALDNLSLKLEPGEVYGLLGPNGAGKTTTINVICNLLKPDEGEVYVAGQLASQRTKRLVGVAPQENLLYRTLTCAENLDFFAKVYGLSRAERRHRVEVCLELVHLSDRARSPVETLSGGMQRRVSVAVALVHNPKLVILDEPTTGLDIEARYELWDLIRTLQSQGTTVLLTTHLLEEAERLCQRIGVIREGRLLAEGTLAELKSRVPGEALAFVGTPDLAALEARAEQLGYPLRRYDQDVVLCLPEVMDLKGLLAVLEGVPITAAAIQPVRLEQAYLEITRQAMGTSVAQTVASGD